MFDLTSRDEKNGTSYVMKARNILLSVRLMGGGGGGSSSPYTGDLIVFYV